MKRFLSCDIIDGTIAESPTLNVYAYVCGNPISFVDPFGLCRDDKNTHGTMSLEDRLEYINAHLEGNMIYELLKSWNVSFTSDVWESEDVVVDMFWGGVKTKIKVSYSFQTSLNADITTDFSLNDMNSVHEISTPELTIPWTEVNIQYGAYTDSDR